MFHAPAAKRDTKLRRIYLLAASIFLSTVCGALLWFTAPEGTSDSELESSAKMEVLLTKPVDLNAVKHPDLLEGTVRGLPEDTELWDAEHRVDKRGPLPAARSWS
jgi:hypothetical protein